MNQLRINPTRLHDNLEDLARIGRTAEGGVSRVAFTDADIEGREFTKDLMRKAGLAVRVDAVGNIFGRLNGADDSLPPILVGSHIDTVPNGGAYDGALGVLAAIEVAQTLEEGGHECRHPLEVVVWSEEEGGLSGSRAFVGDLAASELDGVVAGGMSLRDGIERIGGDPEKIGDANPQPRGITAYIELHVEQGGRLEAEAVDIGVVSGIVGIRHYAVTFTGTPNHAGTTPMDQRKNALLSGSEFVLAVDRVVRSVEGTQVGTVGEMTVHPGAPNVIPGIVNLTVELRDVETERIESLWNMLEPELKQCAVRHGTAFESAVMHSLAGVGTSQTIQDAISGAAEDVGCSHCLMPSGAGHDAQNLANVTPTGMIFVPSVDGVSHSPAEYTKPEDVEKGAQVLLNSVLRVDLVDAPRVCE